MKQFEQRLMAVWSKRPQGNQPRAWLAQQYADLAQELIAAAVMRCQTPEDQEAIAAWHGWVRPDAISWEDVKHIRRKGTAEDCIQWLLDNQFEWMNGVINDCEYDDAQHLLDKHYRFPNLVGSYKQLSFARDILSSDDSINAIAEFRRSVEMLVLPRNCGWWIEHRNNILDAIAQFQETGGTGATLCDLDGSLRESASGSKFINAPYDQQPIAGALEALEEVKQPCIGCTNQRGVKQGYKTLDSAIEEQQRTLELFPKLQTILFCPDEGETCWAVKRDKVWQISEDYLHLTGEFRKPGVGMLLVALNLAKAEPAYSKMIGDRPEDEQAAQAASVPFQWAHEFRKMTS